MLDFVFMNGEMQNLTFYVEKFFMEKFLLQFNPAFFILFVHTVAQI